MTLIEPTDMNALTDVTTTVLLGALNAELDGPVLAEGSSPLEYAEALGEAYLSSSGHNHRKNGGHYLTPAAIARFMAEHSSYSESHVRVLDPGSGMGMV